MDSALAPVESRLFDLLTDPWRPERIRYVHGCRGHGYNRPTAVPARFVLACGRGHLDDFPWLYYVHGGQEPEGGEHTLRLSERGTTGEASNLFVDCSCGKSRPMAQALGRESWKHLPGCRGRHPHLGSFIDCGIETRTLGLGATNSWFAMQVRAFSLPLAEDEVDQQVAANWPQLSMLAAVPEQLGKKLLPSLACWPDVEPYGVDAVWLAIRRRAEEEEAGEDEGRSDIDLKGPEWQAFIRPAPIELPDFTTRKEPPPPKVRAWLPEVVLVPRLREVSALYGFTRIDSPEWDILSTDRERISPISRDAPSWVPCAQTRGEGILLRFSEDRLAAWENQAEIIQRGRILALGPDKWRADRRLAPGEWPGARYVLLHPGSCADPRVRAGMRVQRVRDRRAHLRPQRGRADGRDHAVHGGPGQRGDARRPGLTGRRDRLGSLIEQALDAARLCWSDPLCADHDPRDRGDLFGAACHACLFASETSCERGNHYLARALLVDTVTGAHTGFLH